MDNRYALIGFGEAGSTFAKAADLDSDACAYDLRQVDYGRVKGCTTNHEAVRGANVVFSLVPADQSLLVAQETAMSLTEGTLFLDMNSVSPGTKRQSALAIDKAGGRYVDVAIMAPVEPQRLAVPVLLSGYHAQAGLDVLKYFGFSNLRVVGADVGRASTIKMLRSVMYKGMEALTAECLLGCEKAGVTDEVLKSFGNDWSGGADYRLDRMLVHGQRRSAEMAESAKTLLELGVEPLMTLGTVQRQAQLGTLGIKEPPKGLHAKLERITS